MLINIQATHMLIGESLHESWRIVVDEFEDWDTVVREEIADTIEQCGMALLSDDDLDRLFNGTESRFVYSDDSGWSEYTWTIV